MLKIVCTQKAGVSYPLVADKKYTVGRKQGDIVFPDDQSVSRVHAELVVEHEAGNITEPVLTPVLTVTDVGSKFGTFATNTGIESKIAISAREPVTLSIGDRLRFGLQWNEFTIDYTPLVITTSSTKPTSKFKEDIQKLGGHLINEWNGHVTHVVMDSLTLTIKAVCALLSGKPIVTPSYITDLLSSFETRKPGPEAKNFLPKVSEKEFQGVRDCNFYPNPARSVLFAGKTFLFCTPKHHKKLASAIEAGGGTAELASSAAGVNIGSNEYIMMGHPLDIEAGMKDPSTRLAIENYKRCGKRFIGDSEIGLAAIFISTEKHCNPKFNMKDAVLPHLASQTQVGSSIPSIVPETQEVETQKSSVGDTSRSVVDDTIYKHGSGDDAPEKASSSKTRGEKRPSAASSSSKDIVEVPSAKKRSAVESLTGPNSKRLKEIPNSASSRTTRSSHSSRALTSLFNMSDSSDDEIVPASPDCEEGEDSEVVPESQPQPPLVNIVDVRDLQSVSGSQESEDEESLRVPETMPTQTLPRNNAGTDNIMTVTESVMNAKTVPILNTSFQTLQTPQTPSSSKKTPLQISEAQNSKPPTSTTRKRRRDEDDKSLAEETKKINLQDCKVNPYEFGELPIAPIEIVAIPMMVNERTKSRECSFVEYGESAKKNFKTFKKVLPRFLPGSDEENANRTTRNMNESVMHNIKPVKLVPYEYRPGSAISYAADLPPPLVSRKDPPTRHEEMECPPGFQAFDDGVAVESRATRSSRRNEPAPPAPGPAPPQRRQSPRKNAPRVVMGPPPPPPKPIPMEEEEDEEDMWSFPQARQK